MPAGWWWRGALVAAAYVAVVVLYGTVRGTAFGPGYGERLGVVAIGAVLAGYGAGPLAARLRLPAGRRIAVVFGVVFVLLSLSNVIEVALYLPASTILATLIGGAVQSAGLAVALALLFPPPDTGIRLGAALAVRSPLDWVWRAVVLAVLWVPVFLLFAALDTPVVEALEHSGGTSTFRSPPAGELMLTESVRGLLHALVFVLLAALLTRGWRTTWFWCALAVALLNGWVPIVASPLPGWIRVANGVEITLSSITFGLLGALLLAGRARREAAWHAG